MTTYRQHPASSPRLKVAGPQLLVIGLDCAAPELVFKTWRDDLPTLRQLIGQALYARLESCVPPLQCPPGHA